MEIIHIPSAQLAMMGAHMGPELPGTPSDCDSGGLLGTSLEVRMGTSTEVTEAAMEERVIRLQKHKWWNYLD